MTNSTHNSDQSIQWYIKAAETGDVPSMVRLAYFYLRGKNNVEQDYNQAMYWAQKAAAAGDAEAMVLIGDMFEGGKGVQKDLEEAARWMRMAAESGSDWGMLCLASDYINGAGVPKDDKLAFYWFQKAAATDATAMFIVGCCYRDGRGTLQDYTQAMQWFLKGAEAGNVDAMMEVAYEYNFGEHIQQDQLKALHWYQKAAEAGNADAMYMTGGMYHSGNGVAKDNNTALFWFRKADGAGNKSAAFACAKVYEELGDYDNAIDYYRRAAALDDARAMFSLGEIYYLAEEKKDGLGAVHWYKQAAERGVIDAFERLGLIFAQGFGVVSKDEILAMEYYQKAADEGNALAMRMLGTLYAINIRNSRGQTSKADFDKAEYWLRKAISAGEDVDQEVLNKVTQLAKRSHESWCFITTAVCSSFGKGDDCYELTMFRQFRDGWLNAQPDGEQLIREYYDIAPTIVMCIDALDNAKEIYSGIWQKYLSPCLSMLEKGNLAECKAMYTEMVLTLKQQFMNK